MARRKEITSLLGPTKTLWALIGTEFLQLILGIGRTLSMFLGASTKMARQSYIYLVGIFLGKSGLRLVAFI